jgi:hypothetical protein
VANGSLVRATTYALDFGAAHFGGRQHCRQVLTQQAWPFASSANLLNTECFSSCKGKAQRGTQDLPAALAKRSIDPNHDLHLLPGLDPRKQNISNVGRPIRLVDPGAEPISEILPTA